MRPAPARVGSFWRPVLAAFLVAGALIAPAAVAYAAPVGGPAVITGTVRSLGGAPIPGITVSVDAVETSDTGAPGYHHAVTKADGTFVLADMPQGTYRLTVNEQSALGAVAAWSEKYVWSDWATTDEFGSYIDTSHFVAADATTSAGVIALAPSGTVSGCLMDGATPVSGSVIAVNIVDTVAGGTTSYMRWLTTGADGRFTIPNARPGDYTLTYTASGSHVPVDAVPGGATENSSICSGVDSFSVGAGATVVRPNYLFQAGGYIDMVTYEGHPSFDPTGSVNVSGIQFTMTSEADQNVVYSFQSGDNGWARCYMPPGQYFLAYTDQYGVYEDGSLIAVQVVASGGSLHRGFDLAPKAGTYAIAGHVGESGTGVDIYPWVESFKKSPDPNVEPESFRNLEAGSDGKYLVRVPADTGYTGNQMIVRVSDRNEPHPHVDQSYTTPVNPTADIVHNFSMPVGGSITGVVHDSDGVPVEGVLVNVMSVQWVPFLSDYAWTGANHWYTHTAPDGTYEIGGLPAGTDYKVNFSAYYDAGMPLPIKYADYYRRTYKNKPLLDSLNTSATPIAVDHTPVVVTLGHTTASINETISLGGYVALHADGPSDPTGAVYCDVMYNVGVGKWVEIDSGYTTGGTFQKLWKVLPTGNYRLDYKDYFGRGSGSWFFTLNAGDKKYTSVIVPTPISAADESLAGSFAGLIGGGSGLIDGGTGGLRLAADSLGGSLPAGVPPAPAGLLHYPDSAFDFIAAGAPVNGVWTLTLPYDPGIPDGVVGNIRVWHVKSGGVGELLTPIAWNTAAHTLQVQTASLSPFQVVYSKQKVVLGTPTTSGTLKANHTFTAYVTLSPKHTAGLHSVQVKAYKYSSRSHKWVVYKTINATNQDYRTATRCKASVKLPAGTYRLYGYAGADSWHLATLGKYRTIKLK